MDLSEKINLINIVKFLSKKLKASVFIQITLLSILMISLVSISVSIQNPKKEIPTEAYTTPTPTPVVYTCNGTCFPESEPCYQRGTGTCPLNRFCCLIANSPTPRPTLTPTPIVYT